MADKTFVIRSDADAKNFAAQVAKGLSRPIRNAKEYFVSLGALVDRDVQQQFRNEGAAGGPRAIPFSHAWAPFSGKTLKTKVGTWRIRYGTDKKPKRTRAELQKYVASKNLMFKKGPMRGYKGVRRYSFNSKLLQASGGYRKSWKVVRANKKMLKYQTVSRLGGKIGKDPFRPVLFVTDKDIKRYTRKFQIFIDKEIIF